MCHSPRAAGRNDGTAARRLPSASVQSDTRPLISQSPITAADLIRQLDAAGIKRAAVLSTAYLLASPGRNLANEREAVIADNDWTAAQVAQFAERLVGFRGVNPLKDYSIDEIERCAKDPNLRRGLKLHFGNSRVDYQNPAHIQQLRRVFQIANRHGMAIVVHMRVITDGKFAYGSAEALRFLNELTRRQRKTPCHARAGLRFGHCR